MPANQELKLPAVVADRLLIVPDYQRPYAWGEKQLNDLWEDLDLLGSAGAPGARGHYAGTLVLRDITQGGSPVTSVDDEGTTLRHTEVVDGQQRLTTCFLLLNRIRHRLQLLQHVDGVEVLAQALLRKYGVVKLDNATSPRLRLAPEMNTVWQTCVLQDEQYVGAELNAGQRRLMQAMDFVDNRLDTMLATSDDAERFRRLRELQRRITDGLGFLIYEVESLADVGVIFETVNERGRHLSDLEKTKNYLLYLVRTIKDGRADELAMKINKTWSEIFTNLGSDASGGIEDQLMRAHWLITQDPDRQDWKRIDSIKSRFDRSHYVSGATRIVPPSEPAGTQEAAWDRLYADVQGYVETLRKCSYFMRDIVTPAAPYEPWSTEEATLVRRRAEALRRSGVTALYRPLLLAARLARPHDSAFYASLLEACERYSARVFFIEQRRQNAGEFRLVRLGYELVKGRMGPDEVLANVYALIERYAPDTAVAATLGDVSLDWYHRRGHKYFLYEYELHLTQHEAELPPLAFFTDQHKEQRTTEHILPQNPAEGPGGDCWRKHFTDEEHDALVHSLGNLVLTYDNSSYSNKCFVDKRGEAAAPGVKEHRCYAQAQLAQENKLAFYVEWSPATIEARHKELAAWAIERWPLPAAAAQGGDEDDSIEDEQAIDQSALVES